jgi:hypothetical protein
MRTPCTNEARTPHPPPEHDLDEHGDPHPSATGAGSTEPPTARLSVRDARRAADEAQACYHELQRRNDAMIERRRDAIDRGDLMQSHRLAPEHRRIVFQLRNAAHEWNMAVARLLDAELNERGY